MTTTRTDEAARLEAEAAALREQQQAEDERAAQARHAAEVSVLETVWQDEADQAREARDSTMAKANDAAAAGAPLAELYEKFCAAMEADVAAGAAGSAAGWLDRVSPVPRTGPVVTGYERDFRPRPSRSVAMFPSLTFSSWLDGAMRQRRDHLTAQADKALADRVTKAADAAEAKARKAKT